MTVVGMILRTLLGVPLFFYLPGYIADRLWLPRYEAVTGVERHITRCAASVLLSGWLAFLLAELGIFSYWLLAAILLSMCLVGFFAVRSRPTTNHASHKAQPLGFVAGPQSAFFSPSSFWSALSTLRFDHLLLGVALLFGVLVARPFEVIRGGLDAGVYANTGIAIARTGSIVQYDPIVADLGQRKAAGDDNASQVESNLLGTQNPQRYVATRARAAGFFINSGELAQGRVVPQFFHLWPVWIAVFVSMLGPIAGLVATGAAGTLGVVLIGLIGRRIGGSVVGLLAALFLALMTPQVWFSRMSTSEALAQALMLLGLWAFMHFVSAAERNERIWWGVIVGGAFGQFALTRIDFFWAAGPAISLLVYVALTRRWHAGYSALALTLGGLLLHTALHAIFISRAYLIDTGVPTLQKYALTIYASWPLLSPELQAYTAARPRSRIGDWPRLAAELGLVAVFLGGLLLLWWWPRPMLIIEQLAKRWRKLLLGIVVLSLGVLACYAYLIRPEIITRDALLNPLRPDNWLRLQGYIGAPIEAPVERYLDKPVIATDLANMARLGWYLSPLGVLIGTVGLLLLWWRLDRRTWLFLLIATLYAYFWILSLQGTTERTYIYILRRYVPVVYPAYAIGIAYALGKLLSWQPRRWPRLRVINAGLFSVLSASLVLFFAVTGRTVYAHVEYEGALEQVAAISKQIRDEDIVLVRGGGPSYTEVRDTSDLVVAPLTYVYGRNALPVKGRIPGKYPTAFADQITRWRNEGRRVYLLLAASGGDMIVPGYTPRHVTGWNLRLSEFQQLKEQKPKLSYINEVPLTLYELVPSAEAPTINALAYDDTAAQVTGFYRSEPIMNTQQRAAWTNGEGVLRLPSSAQGQTFALTVAGGKRPQSLGQVRMCVDATAEPEAYTDALVADLPWQEIGCFDLPEQLTDVRVMLPNIDATTSLLVRLRSEAWVPANVTDAASVDERGLGIQFGGATWGAPR